MREFTIQEKQQIQFLTNLSVEMTYLEPTLTGLEKSIMDATAIVRSYLHDMGIHDYDVQAQGEKSIVQGYIVTPAKIIKTTVSLYRPKTKQGDPRIWFYGLHNYCMPNDIIAIIAKETELFVINLTQTDIKALYQNKESPVYELLDHLTKDLNTVAQELLSMLLKIAKQPVPTVTDKNSDTGIGRTLEKMLGIEMNSSKDPDYKGIELKSARTSKGKIQVRNRKNLFTKVPDWELSKFKSTQEIIDEFGYYDKKGIWALRCTVNALNPNPQTLQLRLDDDSLYLHEFSTKLTIGDFITWRIDDLQRTLRTKHAETFWVDAKSIIIADVEHFIFEKVKHTKSPIVSQFVPLISSGDITLDHMISLKSGYAHEKGPAFKLKPSSMGLLFPDEIDYELI